MKLKIAKALKTGLLLGLVLGSFSSLAEPKDANPLIQDLVAKDVVKGSLSRVSIKDARLATVVIFLSAKCPCSNSYLPVLSKLAETYSYPLFRFVGVHSNSDEPLRLAQDYFGDKKLSFSVLEDSDGELAERYEAFKTPHVFVLNSKGSVLFQGGVGNNSLYQSDKTHLYLEDALKALQAGTEIQNKDVRTLGCEIKRKKKT